MVRRVVWRVVRRVVRRVIRRVIGGQVRWCDRLCKIPVGKIPGTEMGKEWRVVSFY